MRLDCWMPTLASLNVVAILEAMVWAWSNRRVGIASLLPMTMVTAMVSPSARPRPRMTAPMMPDRANGRTARQMTSQRVAPSANIASRWLPGTAWMTSREMVTIVGRIMIVRMTPAEKRPTP